MEVRRAAAELVRVVRVGCQRAARTEYVEEAVSLSDELFLALDLDEILGGRHVGRGFVGAFTHGVEVAAGFGGVAAGQGRFGSGLADSGMYERIMENTNDNHELAESVISWA